MSHVLTTSLGLIVGLWLMLAFTIWQVRKHDPLRVLPVTVLCLLVAWWCAWYGAELYFTQPDIKLLAHKMQHLGAWGIPVALFVYSARIAGIEKWSKIRHVTILSIIPAIAFILTFSNEQHSLIWQNVRLVSLSDFTVYVRDSAIGAWIVNLYVYGLIALAFHTLRQHYHGSPQGVFQHQRSALLVSIGVSFGCELISLFNLSVLDLTPFSFAITGVIGYGAVNKLRLFDLMPIAYMSLLESIQDAVIILDDQHRVVGINKFAEHLFRRKFGEVEGKTAQEAFAYVEWLSPVVKVMTQTDQQAREVELNHNGHKEVFELRFSPVKDQVGKNIGRMLLLRDITISVWAEDQLYKTLEQQIELNNLRSKVVSIVSHEFRSPLAVIKTIAQLLEKYGDRLDAEQRQTKAVAIRNQVDHLNDLLTDVLSYQRMESGKFQYQPEAVDIGSTCRDIISNIVTAEQRQSRIQLHNHAEALYCCIDKKLLRHIFSNLVGNALKYSPLNSPVTICIEPHGHQVSIEIADKGIGIPESDLSHLFDPFFRASNVGEIQGTGLGLSIVREAVELHGGSIAVKSIDGEGTTFTIQLPLLEISPSSAAIEHPQADAMMTA
jgi:two-component system, OmpR family, sensor histidine kinase VicK